MLRLRFHSPMLGGSVSICYFRGQSRTLLSFGADGSRRQEIVMSATSNPRPANGIDALFSAPLGDVDPDIADAIGKELGRQRDEIELIASENIVSKAVLEAQGSVLTNKYAEGLPGKRYYGGCEYVDVVERLAIERLLKLFGAQRANVQPHSGAQANMAAYFACMQPGDTLLAMDLAHGGHLTHGMHLNFSGKLYRVVGYGVRQG